jgi:YVTN family beta-propeller protein
MSHVSVLRRVSALFAVAVTIAGAAAQNPAAIEPIERLIVLNKQEGTASLYDPKTEKEVALVEVGTGPHEVAVAPDGRTAVVCNYGGQQPGNSLTVIDVAAGKALRTFVLNVPKTDEDKESKQFLRPHGIQFEADGQHVLVTSETSHRLLRVDLKTDSVQASWATPQALMHMVALLKDGKRAFATSIKDGNVAVFEFAETTGKLAANKVIATGAGAEGLFVNPVNAELWVTNRAADTVSVLDAKKLEVAQSLAVAAFPIRVAIAADGSVALVSCAEAGEVWCFDAASKKLLGKVALPRVDGESAEPVGVLIAPDNKTAYVACSRGDSLYVLDIGARAVKSRIATRKGPDGMGWSRCAPPPK